MRVPACAIAFALIATLAACASEDPAAGPAPEAASCDRAEPPADLDPRLGRWKLVTPEHGPNELGVPLRTFDLVDACDRFISLAHSIGPGGKAQSNGPSEVLASAHGDSWTRSPADTAQGASFRDLALGGTTWVAVGHGRSVPGVIAVQTPSDEGRFRQVFQNDGFYFNSVAFGANTFVAVAVNGVAVSSDGETWSWVNVPRPAQYFEVAFGAGRFVIAGVGATLTSTDGRTWSEMRCADPSKCRVPAPPPSSCPPPGMSCPPAEVQMPTDVLALQQVRFVGGKFYAFGASGTLATSDGQTFSPVTNLPDAAFRAVLVRMATRDEPHLVQGAGADMPVGVFVSEDDGASWYPLELERASAVDCRIAPCAAVPQGILAFEALP